MKTLIDINNWKRKETYSFFKDFEEPLFGICVNVDCTNTYDAAKKRGESFFLSYLYKSLLVANDIEAFRYRIEEDNVYLYDKIHASITVLRDDKTFCFSDICFNRDFHQFVQDAQKQINTSKQSEKQDTGSFGNGVIHFSAVPWIHFSSISHARKYSIKCSCPKISFGKVMEVNGRMMMPLSIHAHHALVDGYTAGEFIDLFQKALNEI